MRVKSVLGVCVAGVMAAVAARAQPPTMPETLRDGRELVTMPALPQAVMRQDMLDHLAAVHEILGLLADAKLAEAGELAERSLGFSAMGRHRQQFLALLSSGAADAPAGTAGSPGAAGIGRGAPTAPGMGLGTGMPMGPGRYMPPAMHAMGMGMHQAASAFAIVAKEGDLAKALVAFQPVTASCVACHRSYRTR